MIPHNRPTLGKEEKKAIDRVISSKQISQSIEVRKFEEEFEDYLKLSSGSVVAISNGTAGLYVALKVLKAKGKNVIFPSYSCSSLRHATSMAGGKEKICDIDLNSPNMRSDIGKRGDTVIFPQMYGLPTEIKKRAGVNLIEDACQSLGSKVKDTYSGLQGHIGVFSFYATKLITSAGQGGMLVSKDKSLITEIKDFLKFDLRRDKKSRFNFQMTDIQAAMGRIQLGKINDFIAKRNYIFNFYKKLNLNFLELKKNNKLVQPVAYRSILLCKDPNLLIRKLKKYGIQTINPLETWELLGDSNKQPISHTLTKQTVSLPCYPSLTKSDLNYICKIINKLKYVI